MYIAKLDSRALGGNDAYTTILTRVSLHSRDRTCFNVVTHGDDGDITFRFAVRLLCGAGPRVLTRKYTKDVD